MRTAFTTECVCLCVVAWCVLDEIIYRTLGNEYTISFTLLGVAAGHPLFAVGVVYALNLLCGHLFMPAIGHDRGGWEWVWLGVALLPVAATLVGMVSVPAGDVRAFAERISWRAYLALLGVAGVGLAAGWLVAHQHVE